MEETKNNQAVLEIPKEAQAEAKNLIVNAFRLFADETKHIADEIGEFNKNRQKARERMQNGARRTSGRIV
jgi:hypothetical protein